MSGARLEVLVEPFRENDPGPHVTAAIDVLDQAGLHPEMGPFATVANGEIDEVAAAVAGLLRAAFANGASAVHLQVNGTGD